MTAGGAWFGTSLGSLNSENNYEYLESGLHMLPLPSALNSSVAPLLFCCFYLKPNLSL